MLSALIAMQQADAAFPSGAFAFSNGIEGLAALPFPFDGAALRRHAEGALRHRWIGTDRVALIHAFRANADIDRLAAIDHAVEAATLVEPLRTGSRRAGRALLTSHVRLGTPAAEVLKNAVASGTMLGHLPTIQGGIWHRLGLSEHEAEAISGYQMLSGFASASVRLGRIGAIEAQGMVRDLLPLVADLIREPIPASIHDIELSSFVPFLEVATMRNDRADLRLFAN